MQKLNAKEISIVAGGNYGCACLEVVNTFMTTTVLESGCVVLCCLNRDASEYCIFDSEEMGKSILTINNKTCDFCPLEPTADVFSFNYVSSAMECCAVGA